MPAATRGRLFLIDGSSQMYRAYHAIRGLTGPDGKSTNAVYGFVTMLRKLIADHQPDLIAAAFDLRGPTFRSDLSADYKANRAPMPPDLVEQVPWVHEACEALGVPVLTSERFEADDVIGTLATRAATDGFEVAIVTGDKDFFQLVGGRIKVFNPRDPGTWYDEEGVEEKMGVKPAQVVDVLALMGDSVDNVKGVPGIGEKGARSLIVTYGSLDALLERAEEVPQKRQRTALLEHREAALESRVLVTIRSDAPVELDPGALRYRGANPERCFELFTTLGFRTLVADYAPTAETTTTDYAIVSTRDELETLATTIRDVGRCGLRVLGDSSDAMRATLVGIAVSTAPRQARYVPLGHRALSETETVASTEALPLLRPLLEDPEITKVGHDLKPDVLVLARHGVHLAGIETDTMLLSYLLDSTRSTHRLEDVGLEQVGYRAIETQEVLGTGAKALSWADLPPEAIVDLAGERADLALQLADVLRPRVTDAGLDRVYADLEQPLIPVLVDIERAGVRVDVDALHAMADRVGRELAERSGSYTARRGSSSTSTRPSSSPRSCSRSSSFRRSSAPARRGRPRRRSRSWRSWP